jgi:hypothetical protein
MASLLYLFVLSTKIKKIYKFRKKSSRTKIVWASKSKEQGCVLKIRLNF